MQWLDGSMADFWINLASFLMGQKIKGCLFSMGRLVSTGSL
jgi:hypothetical protein